MPFGASSRLSRRRVLAAAASLFSIGSAGGLAGDYTRGSDAGGRPAVVGHRGAAGLAPPNTIAGIRRALEHDVDGVELDVPYRHRCVGVNEGVPVWVT